MIITSVSLEEADLRIVRKITKGSGEKISSFIRRAVREKLVRMGVIKLDDVERKGLEAEPEQRGGS